MATNTYVALKSGTITGSTVSYIDIDLTGITGYTDLRVVMTGGYTYTDCSAVWQFNGDTTSSYSYTFMYGQGSGSGGSYRGTNQTNTGNTGWYPYPNTATTQGVSIVDVMNFSNPNIYKTILIRNGVSVGGVWAGVSTWRKTDPITSIKVDLGSYNNPYFTVGSTYTVYGIAAQPIASTAKATGGTITYDIYGNVIHTFTTSGTFTPTEPLSAEYLVIGGGGGGGGGYGAGGGAGGYLESSNYAMVPTAYTVQVGSGGAGGSSTNGSTGNGSYINGNSAIVLAYGGGYGAGPNTPGSRPGGDGASGGGGGYASGTAGAAIFGSQGYPGGTGPAGFYGGAGGGGAGGPGQVGASQANCVGGIGRASAIDGVVRASGGSGYSAAATAGGGGSGNGGTIYGTENTGGGGGTENNGPTASGGNGGSGIVIIRYKGV